jgi:hypothetical protein
MRPMRRHCITILIAGCLLLVAAWEIAAHRSRHPFRPFALTAADFAGFVPRIPGWTLQTGVPVPSDPAEPNILYFPATANRGAQAVARLVHGYNMPMCMKIKGYAVALLQDNLRSNGSQVWRVTSRTGHVSVWVTSMLRSGDFMAAGVDIRRMAFPYVGIPDEVGWAPDGLTLRSLRHPVANLRQFLRARWNASRCDWLTFLGLRQPAWASAELLSLVTASTGSSVPDDRLADAMADIPALHAGLLRELRAFQNRAPPPAESRKGR